jgi:hypothetical protein
MTKTKTKNELVKALLETPIKVYRTEASLMGESKKDLLSLYRQGVELGYIKENK